MKDESSKSEIEKQTNEDEVINYTIITFNNEIFDSPKISLLYNELLKAFYDLYNKLKKINKNIIC